MRKQKLFIAVFFLLSFACNRDEVHETEREESFNVKAQSPREISFIEPVRVSGILSTRQQVKLSFKTGGIIESINVREGQKVKKGQLLASLDLSEIKAQVSQAAVSFEKAERDYRRAKNLFQDSVVTLETVQNAKSAVDLARAQKNIAEFNLKHSRIVAPSTGKIEKVVVEQDELVGPGYPVILFATTENEWVVKVPLTDRDIVKFKEGDSASVEMDAFDGRVFSSRLTELGALSDPVTGTYETELLIEQADPEFRTGFIVRATLFPSDSISSFWLPLKAVQDIDRGTGYIFKVQGNRAKKYKVQTGALKDSGILVLEGIAINDTIVTEGAGYLKNDALISIVEPEKE